MKNLHFKLLVPKTATAESPVPAIVCAHGDREHGFIGARLRIPRKIVAGYWQDADVQGRLGNWMRAAVGAAVSRSMKVMRFGDNMREVAVTEGDRVEAQTKLGWQVNT